MDKNRVVHIIDDDRSIGESLGFLLGTEAIEYRTHLSVEYFLSSLPDPDMGCVITDVRMPGRSGLELIKDLRHKGLSVPVIVITGHGDIPLAVAAMRAGAFDFLEKPYEDKTVLNAVAAALKYNNKLQEKETTTAQNQLLISSLTEREHQVMARLVEGRTNKAIAKDLGISPRTVEIYRANIMHKLEAESLSDVIRMAISAEGAAAKPLRQHG